MLQIKISPFVGRELETLLHEISVVGMNSRQYLLQCGLSRSIVFKDIVGFLRPVDFSAEHTPTEAASVTYVLPLSQECLAAVQVGIKLGILQRNRGLRSKHLQHCDPVRREGARRQIVLEVEHPD